MIRAGKWILGAALLAAPAVFAAQAAAQAAPPAPPSPPAGPEGAPYGRAWGRGDAGPGMGWGNRFGPGDDSRGQGRGFARRGPGHMGRGMRSFGPGGMGMRGRGEGLGMMLRNPEMRERLGVTPEQAAKIQQQESAFAQSRIRTRADLEARQLELRGLMEAETPDRALVDRKMKELSDARLAAEKAQFEHQLTMRNALTPEQKQKLEAWRKEMRQNMQQHRPGFGPGGPGPGGPGFRRPQPPPQAPGAPKPPDQPE